MEMNEMDLTQLQHLRKEIALLEERIRKLEKSAVTDVVTGSSAAFPYSECSFIISGIPSKDLTRLQQKLRWKVAKLVKEQERLLRWIYGIEDSEMRQIFLLRYLDGLSWQQIALKLGRAGDGSTERKRHNRFLEQFSRVS